MRGSNPYALTLALLGACTGEADTPEPLGSLEPWVDVLVEQPVAGFAPGGGSEVVFSAAGQSQLWTSVATPEVISVTETGIEAAARTPEGLWLVMDGELLLWDTALRHVPWADSLGLISRLDSTSDALWIAGESGLVRRSGDALTRYTLDGEGLLGPAAPGGRFGNEEVVWASSYSTLVAIRASDGAVIDGVDLGANVTDLAASTQGDVLAVAGRDLWHYRDGSLQQLAIGDSRPNALYSRADADPIWVHTDDGWLHFGPDGLHRVEVPGGEPTAAASMDAWGRLLLANEQGLVRVAADRPVDIVGLSRGQEVVRPEPVRLLPTSPQLVTTIEATLVRGREEVLLEVGDGEATVDPLGLVFGTWTLEVQVTYEDGSILSLIHI